MKLAGLARAGELMPIAVPDSQDEAMRDLVRTREDAVAMQRQARQRLAALLLRNDLRYAGKTAWTDAHRRWIARLKLPSEPSQVAFEEYVAAIEEATRRVKRLTQAIRDRLASCTQIGLVICPVRAASIHRFEFAKWTSRIDPGGAPPPLISATQPRSQPDNAQCAAVSSVFVENHLI